MGLLETIRVGRRLRSKIASGEVLRLAKNRAIQRIKVEGKKILRQEVRISELSGTWFARTNSTRTSISFFQRSKKKQMIVEILVGGSRPHWVPRSNKKQAFMFDKGPGGIKFSRQKKFWHPGTKPHPQMISAQKKLQKMADRILDEELRRTGRGIQRALI